MFSRIRCMGTWPGPSFITCTSYSHAIRVSSPCVFSSANCASSLASAIEPGPQAVAERERDVVGAHDLADLAEVRVEEVLLVMRQTPLRDDRAAARDDPGHAPGGERDVAEQHAGMHREVVHALLGLLDERVAVDLPGQVLGHCRRLSRAPGRSARCRSAPANCAGSTRASRGCSCPSTGPSPCRRPRAWPSAACPLPPRSRSRRPSCRCWR